MATEVAYYTYIYAKVDKVHYMKVTSHTRAAIMAGRFVAGSLGQTLVNTGAMDYLELNYITFGGMFRFNLCAVQHRDFLLAQIFSTLWAFILPAVPTSIYFHRKKTRTVKPTPSEEIDNVNLHLYVPSKSLGEVPDAKLSDDVDVPTQSFKLLWYKFCTAYSNSSVVIWSIWYAMGMCGYLQAVSYIQVLWMQIDSSQPVVWNGAVEAVNTLLGAGVSILAGYVYTDRLSRPAVLWMLVVCSVCEAGALILASQTTIRFVSYFGYLLFYVMYSFMITVAR